MIFKTVDTIPAKLFYKIVETGDVSLLSDNKADVNENTSIKNLNEIWLSIQEEDEKNNPNSNQNKIIRVHSEIESYLAKLEFIRHAIHYLKILDDKELKALLEKEGYFYKNKDDLDRILRQSDGINDKIDRLKLKLPKNKDKQSVPFDEMVISCGVISGAGFVDTNKITKTQLDALIKVTQSKIKASTQNGNKR